MEFFRIRRDIPFMRHALVFNIVSFVTFALAAAVSAVGIGRFSSSIADLQQKLQKRAEVADVSRAGAAMTATMRHTRPTDITVRISPPIPLP